MNLLRITPVLIFLLVATAAPGDAQSVSEAPTYGEARLSAGFTPDPWSIELTAGGDISVSQGQCTYGYVADAPDVDLYWEGNGGALYIYVIGDGDTTLLVNTSQGGWICDDDSFGDGDPIVAIPKAASGLYDIWIGTYGDSLVSAILYISELDPRQQPEEFWASARRIRF